MARREEENPTSPTLLARVGDWRDHEAWVDFVARYDATLRLYLSGFELDPETLEELMQRIWIELADRLKTFSYDPSKKFRGWLKLLSRSRAIDLIRKRQISAGWLRELGEEPEFERRRDDDSGDDDRPDLVRLGEEVQALVRSKVDDRTWQAFWLIVVEGQEIDEAAEALGYTYAAAFAAQKRVRKRLQEEGRRLLLEREQGTSH